MKISRYHVFAASLRGIILLARFSLIIILAFFVSPMEMGLFALYMSGIQLSASLIGLDVYSHTTRLLLLSGAPKNRILSSHMGFVAISCVGFIPLSVLLFYLSSPRIPGFLLIIFCGHLPFEYYNQEIGRLLIPLGRPITSILIQFVRSALWVPFGLLAYYMGWSNNLLWLFVIFWFSGSMLAALFSFVCLRVYCSQFIFPKVNPVWLKTALLSSGFFFGGTLIFRAILGGDRFIVNRVLGVESVGIYSVYVSICMGGLGLLESGIAAWRFPSLVSAIQTNELNSAKKQLWCFFKDNLYLSLLLLAGVGLVFTQLVPLLLDKNYTQDLKGFYAIILGVFTYSLSMPFHYFLYGLRWDKTILFIYLSALVVMIIWAFMFMEALGVTGAGIMLALAMSTIALLRFFLVMVFFWEDSKEKSI